MTSRVPIGRQTVLAVAIAVLVVFAGCSTGSTESPPPETTEPRGTPPTATSTPSATPTPTATVTPTDTSTPTPTVLDERGISDRHNDTLRAAGSFTVAYRATLETSGGTVVRTYDVVADLEAERGHSTNNLTVYDADGTPNSTITARRFVDGGSGHRQLRAGEFGDLTVINDTWTGRVDASSITPDDGKVAMLGSEVERWVEGHDWVFVEETTYDGERVERFEIATEQYDDVSLAPFTVEQSLSDAKVLEATLLLGDGVVRHLSLVLEATRDGEPLTIEVEFAVTDVGETTVDAPEWVDRLRSNAVLWPV